MLFGIGMLTVMLGGKLQAAEPTADAEPVQAKASVNTQGEASADELATRRYPRRHYRGYRGYPHYYYGPRRHYPNYYYGPRYRSYRYGPRYYDPYYGRYGYDNYYNGPLGLVDVYNGGVNVGGLQINW